jgi:outer membrane receptor for ferrienterochelin and colicins
LVSPHRTLSLRQSGGRGYRAPSAKEVGFVFDHSVFGYRVIGNPNLVPETSWGLQADAGWRAHRFVELRASGFANWVDDLIDLQLAPASTGLAGVDDHTYVNVGAARTSGAGASVRVRAHEWLRAEAGYTYLFTRDETIDRPLPGRPPHTFVVSAFAQTPIGLAGYARFRAVLDAYLEDTLRAPAFATLDLRVSQKTWPGGEVYAGVLDLLGVQKDPDRPGDQRPAEGRTFYLGLSSELPPMEQ